MVLPTQEKGTKIEQCCGGARESDLRGNQVELTCSCRQQCPCEGRDEMDLGQNF